MAASRLSQPYQATTTLLLRWTLTDPLESNHILDSVRLKLVEGGKGVVEAGKEVVPCCRGYHHANLSISWGGREGEGLTKVAGHRKLRLGCALWTHSLQHCWLPQSTSDGFSPLHLVLLPLIFFTLTFYPTSPSPLPPLPLSLCLPPFISLLLSFPSLSYRIAERFHDFA